MDLSYGEAYEEFRKEVQAFLAENWPPAGEAAELSRKAQVDRFRDRAVDVGYLARSIPRKYGGSEQVPDALKAAVIAEEFRKLRAPMDPVVVGVGLLVPTLLEKGTDWQKEKFIRPTMRGHIRWCQGYSEPGSGSDLASLQTKGELVGDEWLINGQKIWTSTAHLADWIFCLVRTEPEAPKHQGISFLLFRMDTPGIEVRPLIDMTMDRNFNETFFTDVRVPKHQIVGQRGQGWQVANAILGHERGSLAPPDAAMSRLDGVINLMNTESIAREKVINNPVFRDRLMKLQGRVLAMQCNDMRLLSARINKNQDAKLAAMIVKLQGTELRHEIEALAIDVMGEIGIAYADNPYLRGNGSWQYQYMLYLGLIIGGGTSQIQKNIISERGLGMPKEPKVETK